LVCLGVKGGNKMLYKNIDFRLLFYDIWDYNIKKVEIGVGLK